MLKKFFIRIFDIRRIIKRKNAQLREEREKLLAAEAVNRILSTYLLCFIKETGEIRVSKNKISDEFGKYRVEVSASDEEYVMSVRELTDAEKRMFKTEIAWRRPSRANGANAKASHGGKGNKSKVNSRTEDGEGIAKN